MRHKHPKPVEAWACASYKDAGSYEVVECHFCVEGWVDYMIENDMNPRSFRVIVTLVPVKPKPLRVRKAKKQ